MNSEHITRFEISNFKKFEHLVVENIGQVNLITGDNNVGKTCLLEALLLKPKMKSIISLLAFALENRNFQLNEKGFTNPNDLEGIQSKNIIGLCQRNLNQPIKVRADNGNGSLFEFSIKNEIINVVETDDEEVKHFAKNLTRYPGINLYTKNWLLFYNHLGQNRAADQKDDELEYMVDLLSTYYTGFFTYEKRDSIISLNDFYKGDLIEIYEEVTKSHRAKKYLIETLNNLFRDFQVSDIEKRSHFGDNHLKLSISGEDLWYPITQFGDGFVRVLRILLEITHKQSSRVMIDEVEVGIHYQKMKLEWKTIFDLAVQTNTQIFATTHSMDCIAAFIEAGSESSQIKDDLRLIELEEFNTPEGGSTQIATTFTYSQMEASVNAGLNLRGGKLW